MDEELGKSPAEELDVARLLRAAGARPAATAQATAEVRDVVAAQWQATVDARRHRRMRTTWAAAAGIAVAAVSVWLARPALEPSHEAIAVVARTVGHVERDRGDGRWTPLADADAIEPGTRLRTSSGGRAALSVAGGVELRLDARTLVVLGSAGHASLSHGAVYLDSGPEPREGTSDFVLETPAGDVRHLGTQYEARLLDGVLHVGVREGRVRVSNVGGSGAEAIGDAGERLRVAGDRVERMALAPNAEDWDWIAAVTPPFSIEGRSVEDFLVWAARETGRTVVYASPDAARRARSVTLSGSVEALNPDSAVSAVLSTTSLRPEIGDRHIRVYSATP